MGDSKIKLGSLLVGCRVLLSIFSFIKDAVWAILLMLVQQERLKNKKLEDQLELLKTEKKIDDEIKQIELKKQNTDPGRGIDDFLQK